MYVVKAARWNMVDLVPSGEELPARRCSVCACLDLGAAGEIALDAATRVRYQVIRCHSCGYDLLESLARPWTAVS